MMQRVRVDLRSAPGRLHLLAGGRGDAGEVLAIGGKGKGFGVAQGIEKRAG